MSFPTIPSTRQGGPPRLILLIVALFLLLFFGRSIAAVVLDYFWWQEMSRTATWWSMASYSYVPGFVAWLLAFVILFLAHWAGVRHAGVRLKDYIHYARLSTLVIAVIALVISLATVEGWTVARFIGSTGSPAGGWMDPVFGKPLSFYFFTLPFWRMLLNWVTGVALVSAIAYFLTARGWQLRFDRPDLKLGEDFDLRELLSGGRLESKLFRVLAAVFVLALAARFWLGRYELLLSDHGNLMVGLDYLEQNLGLVFQTAMAAAAVLAALLILAGRFKWAILCAVVLIADAVVPPLVGSLYVRPNELTLEKPYIQRHLEATRSAFGLDRRSRNIEFAAQKDGPIDFAGNKSLLDNVRLWDWRAFHDTLSQSQPLRPYTYADTDTDRYMIDGRLRQTLLAPRELDLTQLGDARNRWINRALTFTHGYGFAMAEANRITETGLPELLVRDAPVSVRTKSLNVQRPEIYYGEVSGDPVIVRTSQPEFNYPSGSSEVNTTYEGKGGFSVAGFGTRLIAAIAEGEFNIVLSSSLTSESRMIMHRDIVERVGTLAPFVRWDSDPYLVTTKSGRLVWILDGYLISDAHPYSRSLAMEGLGRFNYIRNSIKATIDAYDGDVKMYTFEENEPLLAAYRNLFPELFTPAEQMPEDLRAHARAPEMMFRAQAEMYRTYHMRDPESYYNRADLWDLATFTTGAQGQPEPVSPTYVIAELPGSPAAKIEQPEFLLSIPFTPRNKQNLIGMMVARCDGEHLGELVFLQLPKQEVLQGPLQVEALINQDQNISKDLTLWNQQGSQVLRSQILTLPIDNTFLYVAPIYIQAAQARMPQLKKVALVRGSTLIYADTYDQALAQLEASQGGRTLTQRETPASATPGSTAASPAAASSNDPRIDSVRVHFQRYREFSSQGKWAEAGKELEAIEGLVRR